MNPSGLIKCNVQPQLAHSRITLPVFGGISGSYNTMSNMGAMPYLRLRLMLYKAGAIHSRIVCRSVNSGTIFAGTAQDINSCCFPVQSQEVARRYVFKGVFARVIVSAVQLHRSVFLPVFYLAVLSSREFLLRWSPWPGASASLWRNAL